MHISNRLARLIRESKPAVGMWINLCDPGVAQIGALAGYDWIMIDVEHNPLTESQVQGLLQALAGYDVQSIVRVRANRPEHVEWVLDSGAGGVMVPMMQSAAEFRQCVEICKYHPLGMRGYGPNRASGYWTRGKEYVAASNDDILLIPQIEHLGAVADIDEICQIEGIDGILIGPGDLAQSLGHLENPQHPEVQATIEQIIKAANRHGKPWGIPVGTIEAYKEYVERGGTVMLLGSDTRMLRAMGSEFVNGVRAFLGDHCGDK